MKKTFFVAFIIIIFELGMTMIASGAQEIPEKEQVNITEHLTKTEDGWEISIKRYAMPEREGVAYKAAVILCHGFNFNNLFWDLHSRVSLARYLAENGYDVWAPSLRGSGLSSKPLLSDMKDITRLDVKDIQRGLKKVSTDIFKFNWTIDDHIHQDAPAVIDYVKEKSGFDKVYWIGHSMGGLIMFGYIETEKQDDIAGFIPVGSMAVIPSPLSPHLKQIAEQGQLVTASLIFNTKAAADVRNLTLGAVKYPIEELLLNRENMEKDIIYRLFRECVEDTSPGVVRQFSSSLRTGSMVSSDQKYNYTANLSRVKVPILIMAGGQDAFLTEESLRECYKKVSSRDKKIIIFSKANRHLADYGHCDVLIGESSREDVFPAIAAWLDRRTLGKRPLFHVKRLFNGILQFLRKITGVIKLK